MADLSGYDASHSLTNQQLLDVADINGDKNVTNADLERLICLLANGGGNPSGGATITAVPEPASIVLLVVAGFALAVRRRNTPITNRRTDAPGKPG